jgi:hypothetical protein
MKRVESMRIDTDGMLSLGPHDRLEAALRTTLIFSGDILNF